MGEEGPPVLRRSEKEGSHWPPEPSRITAEYIVILSEQIAKLRLHYWGNTDQAEHIGQRTKNVLQLRHEVFIVRSLAYMREPERGIHRYSWEEKDSHGIFSAYATDFTVDKSLSRSLLKVNI